MLNSGHHVKAVWTDGQMYGARVLQFNGSHYLVAWDDGAPAGWVSVDQIQLHPDGGTPFVIGQNVKARWTDGSMYGARLTQFNGMQYEVAWADGAAPTWLSPHQIQLDGGAAGGAQFANGQHVKAQWTDGGFYGARILQFNGMQYEVAWADGAPNQWLAAHQIHADGGVGAAPNQGFAAPNQGFAAPNQGTGAGIGMAPGPQRGMDAYQPADPRAADHQRAIEARNAALGGGFDPRTGAAVGGGFDPRTGGGGFDPRTGGGGFDPRTGAPAGGFDPRTGAPVGGGFDPHAGGMGGGASYAVGQSVFAPWTDGSMYGARVMQFNGSHYLVAWDDGAPPAWFAPNQIRPR